MIVGGAFGAARAGTLLAVAGVRSAGQLLTVDAKLATWEGRSRRVAVLLEAGLLAASVVGLIVAWGG